MADLSIVIDFYIKLFLILGLISIVWYIIYSISLFKLTKNLGFKNPWISFVPVVNSFYIIETISHRLPIFFRSNSAVKIALIIIILSVILTLVPVLVWVLPLVYWFVWTYFYYLVFDEFTQNPILFTILTTFFILALPLIIFSFRNVPLETIDVNFDE